MIPETAIQSAANVFSLEVQKFPLEQCDPYMREEYTEIATAALQAALPHLEAALRKQIAAEIQDMRVSSDGPFSQIHNTVVEAVADRIAEEGNTK